MENNFEQDSFEDFLKDHLKNHRMFPKDTVWREINQKLHGENRWPGLTIAAFLLVSTTIIICFYFSSKQSIFSIKASLEPLHTAQVVAKANKNGLINQNNIQFQSEHGSLQISTDMASRNEEHIVTTGKSLQPDNYNFSKDNTANESTTMAAVWPFQKKSHASLSNPDYILKENDITFGQASPHHIVQLTRPLLVAPVLSLEIKKLTVEAEENATLKVPVDAQDKALSLIESFKAARHPGKLSILFYLSPSISYRRLVEDQAVLKGNNVGPVGVNQVSDVNDVVRHKPSKGLEGGISVIYDVAKRIRIKAGLQFNVRQYSIDAYKSNTEVSSIALVNNNSIDTLNTIAYYRNFNGNSSTELINRYYQVSMPIGMEWEVVGNKKFQFNVAGSIQPTYILNRNAYLLTTNFKNYAENTDLVRKWNINSNFEAFVTMVTGDVKWQLGPQVRYQPYSTFSKQYPIREHLIDYGVKLGISTRIK